MPKVSINGQNEQILRRYPRRKMHGLTVVCPGTGFNATSGRSFFSERGRGKTMGQEIVLLDNLGANFRGPSGIVSPQHCHECNTRIAGFASQVSPDTVISSIRCRGYGRANLRFDLRRFLYAKVGEILHLGYQETNYL